MTSRNAPLAILTFKAGTLHTEMQDCIIKPGIYGTILTPIELLDTLVIKNGVNTNTMRFAAQFNWNQSALNANIKAGMKIILSENLTFSFE